MINFNAKVCLRQIIIMAITKTLSYGRVFYYTKFQQNKPIIFPNNDSVLF